MSQPPVPSVVNHETAPDASRVLALIRDMHALEDGAHGLVDLAENLATWLRTEIGANEALVLTEEAGHGLIQSGDAGREDLSEEIRAACRVALDAESGWKVTTWGDVAVRPVLFRDNLIAIMAMRGPPSTVVDNPLIDAFLPEAARALAHAAEGERARDRALELETVYEIDRIRDEHLPFDEMVQRIMNRVLEIVPADGAMLSLARMHDDQLVFARHHCGRAGQQQAFGRLADEQSAHLDVVVKASFAAKEMVERPILVGDDVRDTMCMPLILEDEVLGAFVLVSQHQRRFRGRDRRLFAAVCSQTDTAIFEDLKHQRLKNVFKRYVSRDVFAEMLRHEDDFLRGRRQPVTCFFSDLRGFTSVSEKLDVDTVVGMLNEHLHKMSELVFDNGGTVDKFIGDCVMAFFNAPLPKQDHALRAVRTAVAMRDAQNEIAAGWAKRGLPNVKIGIGMHTGEVFVGNIGGETLVSYTIIGDNVNIASRLEGESGPDDILISGEIYDQVSDSVDVESRGEITVRGKTIPVRVYNVTAVR